MNTQHQDGWPRTSDEGETLTSDIDGDGLNNSKEMIYGTNPFLSDTDGDSTNDYQEIFVSMTNPLSSDNVYPDDIIESILELSGTDTNDYMLLVMGSSTNILLTSSSYYPISESIKICSTNQLLDVKLSRNLEVNSNEPPELTEVTSRVYTMDPWVITCYGDDYPGYRPPSTYNLNSTITRNSDGGEAVGGVTFQIPKISVNIISSYSSSYYYYYIMCGCNNLESDLDVAAEVCIKGGGNGLIGTPYIFNPGPITCTASGGGSVFQHGSDVDTIDIGSTIINFYSLYEYAYFTLDMSIDNLENFDEEGNYNYNISVDATSEKLGNSSDAVDIPVDIRYSHGSWSIMSMITPTNAINILNSTNASVDVDFYHSECGNYYLNGTLYITPEGNTDIFTLDDISQEIAIEGNYSTSEDFSVVGCSEELGDMIVDLEFDGDEYHSASYSLTSYALAVSNLTDGISMFTGFWDADNDGTNNVNDLDNAGDFMPFLVKTHETATSAFFRFDFNSSSIKVWKKDGTTLRTNSVDEIQDGVSYSYGDLFSEGAEKTLYVQVLAAGTHSINVTYVLDGVDLWTDSVSFWSIVVSVEEPDGLPMQDVTVTGDSRFRLNPACFEWQYVHVNNEVISYYSTQSIECEIQPETFSDFEWTVNDGTIINPTSKTPIYKPNNTTVPTTMENVILELQLPDNIVVSNTTRTLEVYRDHLERDYCNWAQGTECGTPLYTFYWTFKRYGSGWRMPNSWNCFGSVWHAYNGTKNGAATNIPTAGFSTEIHDEPIDWSTVLVGINRGDFVSFYTYDLDSGTEVMQHAHTCIGDNNLMFGANNEPVYGWYISRDDYGHSHQWQGGSWRWFTTTSEDYYNGINSTYKIFKQTSTNLLNRIKIHRKIQ